MRADLHVDLNGLREAAAGVVVALDVLDACPPDPGQEPALQRLPDGSALVAERERLLTAVQRVREELSVMHAAVRAAAAMAEAADVDVACELRRRAVGEP